MQQVYEERRRRVLEAIHPGILVVLAAPVAIRNNDVEHDYRQDSDLYYLTGFDEPHSAIVLSSTAEKPFTMFVRPRDKEREVWDGTRAGEGGAVQSFGADAAFPIGELATRLPDLLLGHERLFCRLGDSDVADRTLLDALSAARRKTKRTLFAPSVILDPALAVHEHRLLKSEVEIGLMEQACAITAEAHRACMKLAAPGRYEYEIEALLLSTFRQRGSERPAYGSIVGSGPNATVLHYRKNDRRMLEGDLLLIDAGCEYRYYASDVTRTFPVSGRFSDAQRRIYQTVLDAQLASIAVCRAGKTLDEVHAESVRVITDGLVALKLIEGPVDAAIEQERYKPFFMHRTSHYLGMDVHDVGAYHRQGKPRALEPGMVITIEPGIYIAEAANCPAEYRGIGVRIEDDVLITNDAPRVLSADVPKLIEDVERACAV